MPMKRSRISSGTARDGPFFSAAPAGAFELVVVASGRSLEALGRVRSAVRGRSTTFRRASSLSRTRAVDLLRRLGSFEPLGGGRPVSSAISVLPALQVL